MGNLSIWLTPIWVLSLGATAAAIVLLVALGVTWVISRRTAEAAVRLVRESVLQSIAYVVIVLVAISLLAAPIMPTRQVLSSLERLSAVGPYTTTISIPARTDDMEVPVKFEADELQSYSFAADQDLVIGIEKGKAYSNPMILVEGGEAYNWSPSSKRQRLFSGPIDKLFVTNQSDAPTELTINVRTDVPLGGSSADSDYGRFDHCRVRAVSAFALAAARDFDDRPGDLERGRGSTDLFVGAGDWGLSARAVHLYSVQHVWRRREDVQGLGPDDDHGPVDPGGGVDGERFGRG